MNILKKQWSKISLILILLLTGYLSVWGIWDEGFGNEFYAACIKSMIQSWHNFFFVSFDPGGFVTVDKPPVALWIQALFAKIFGFSGWSIILPEALAAVISVAVLYRIVARHFGKTAGFISALSLALSPIFIAVSKTNNMDSILILFMVLATWAMMVAVDKGQLRYLLLSVLIMGIAYNTKTLQAFLILPALYSAYFFATSLKWKRRVLHLAVATVVLVAVSLSWSLIVDLTPASERPYVDNSTSNSELELALGYNGIQRITGTSAIGGGNKAGGNNPAFNKNNSNDKSSTSSQSTANGQPQINGSGQATMGNGQAPTGKAPANGNGQAPTGKAPANGNGQAPTGGQFPTGDQNPYNKNSMPGAKQMLSGMSPGGQNGGNSSSGMFNTGSKGVLRMFGENLGGQCSWFLPFALFTILALFMRMRKKTTKDKGTRNKLLCNAIVFGGSVITMCVWFSVSSFFHQYYLATIAPFIAALVGIGVVEMWKMYKEGGLTGFILPVSLLVTSVVQIVMLSYTPAWASVLIPVVIVLSGIPSFILFAAKLIKRKLIDKIGKLCVAIIITGLLVTPAIWSYTPILYGSNTSLPVAGPSLASGNGMGNIGNGTNKSGGAPGQSGPNGINGQNAQSSGNKIGSANSKNSSYGSSSDTKLINFLLKHNTGEKFIVAVPDSSTAETIILATGKPVMSVGGFSGNDNILTASSLASMVKKGLVKYYMIGGGKSSNESDAVTTWVGAHGKIVSSSLWSSTATTTTKKSSSGTSSENNSNGRNGMSGDFGGESSQTLYDLSSYKSAS